MAGDPMSHVNLNATLMDGKNCHTLPNGDCISVGCMHEMKSESATFPGSCYLCGLSIYTKDKIRRWTVNGIPVAAHAACVDGNIAAGRQL